MKPKSSFKRNAARVGAAALITTAGGGGIFEDLYHKLMGDNIKDVGASLDLPGLVLSGDFEVIGNVPYTAPQKKTYLSIASAAEENSDKWGEWTYLMKGKPTDSWKEIAERQFNYFIKILSDSKFREFVAKMKSGNTITAYAIATGKSLEGMTEEQKKAIACADAIYAAGADECKTISADDPQLGLGAKPGETAVPDAIYQEIKALPYGINDPVVFSQAKGDIKPESNIEAVFYGKCSGGNALCIGVKVKEGTPDDKVATLEIERANVIDKWRINLGIGGKSYVVGPTTTSKEDVAKIKQYGENGIITLEIQNLPEKMKANNDKYVLKVLGANGYAMANKLLDKTRI